MKKLFRLIASLSLTLYCFVALHAQNLLNADLENWVNRPGQVNAFIEPEFWTSANVYASFSANKSVEQSLDAFSGSFAAELITLPIGFAALPYPGFIVYGNPTIDTFASGAVDLMSGGLPVAFKPKVIQGYYQYEKSEAADSAEVEVILKRWNSVAGKQDTVGYAKHRLGEAASYTFFQVIIEDLMPGINPDSIIVAFFSTMRGNERQGGIFLIDDITMDTVVSRSPGLPESMIPLIYPIPFRESLNLQFKQALTESIRIEIIDLLGIIRFSREYPFGTKLLSIPTYSINRNAYLLHVYIGDKYHLSKMILAH